VKAMSDEIRAAFIFIKNAVIALFWIIIAVLFLGMWSSNYDLLPLRDPNTFLPSKDQTP
jgi:hypothetical protein